MRSNFIRFVFFMTSVLLVLVFQNCSQPSFTELASKSAVSESGTGSAQDTGLPNDPSSPNATDSGTCVPTSVTSNSVVKVLFVVDASGSNVMNVGGPGTDPDKAWRLATLNNFIDSYKNRANFNFGLISFKRDSATPHIQSNGKAIFTNNITVVSAGVTSFKNTEDVGATPYKAALAMTKDIIANDLSVNAAQKATYVVVLISDGQPTDYSSPEEVIPDVAAIRALAPSRVSLNSVFYYPATSHIEPMFLEEMIATATKYLTNVATAGGGKFIKALTNEVLNIDNTVVVPGMSCQ